MYWLLLILDIRRLLEKRLYKGELSAWEHCHLKEAADQAIRLASLMNKRVLRSFYDIMELAVAQSPRSNFAHFLLFEMRGDEESKFSIPTYRFFIIRFTLCAQA